MFLVRRDYGTRLGYTLKPLQYCEEYNTTILHLVLQYLYNTTIVRRIGWVQ